MIDITQREAHIIAKETGIYIRILNRTKAGRRKRYLMAEETPAVRLLEKLRAEEAKRTVVWG